MSKKHKYEVVKDHELFSNYVPFLSTLNSIPKYTDFYTGCGAEDICIIEKIESNTEGIILFSNPSTANQKINVAKIMASKLGKGVYLVDLINRDIILNILTMDLKTESISFSPVKEMTDFDSVLGLSKDEDGNWMTVKIHNADIIMKFFTLKCSPYLSLTHEFDNTVDGIDMFQILLSQIYDIPPFYVKRRTKVGKEELSKVLEGLSPPINLDEFNTVDLYKIIERENMFDVKQKNSPPIYSITSLKREKKFNLDPRGAVLLDHNRLRELIKKIEITSTGGLSLIVPPNLTKKETTEILDFMSDFPNWGMQLS